MFGNFPFSFIVILILFSVRLFWRSLRALLEVVAMIVGASNNNQDIQQQTNKQQTSSLEQFGQYQCMFAKRVTKLGALLCRIRAEQNESIYGTKTRNRSHLRRIC